MSNEGPLMQVLSMQFRPAKVRPAKVHPIQVRPAKVRPPILLPPDPPIISCPPHPTLDNLVVAYVHL